MIGRLISPKVQYITAITGSRMPIDIVDANAHSRSQSIPYYFFGAILLCMPYCDEVCADLAKNRLPQGQDKALQSWSTAQKVPGFDCFCDATDETAK